MPEFTSLAPANLLIFAAIGMGAFSLGYGLDFQIAKTRVEWTTSRRPLSGLQAEVLSTPTNGLVNVGRVFCLAVFCILASTMVPSLNVTLGYVKHFLYAFGFLLVMCTMFSILTVPVMQGLWNRFDDPSMAKLLAELEDETNGDTREE